MDKLTLADIEVHEVDQSSDTPTAASSLKTTPDERARLGSTTQSVSIQPSPKSLPHSSFRSYTIGGVHTDMWIQLFQDRILLACSQKQGRIGTWIFCKPTLPSHVILQPSSSDKKLDLDVSVLLGNRDEPMLSVYVKYIMEQRVASGAEVQPLVLGLAMENLREPAVFRTITDLLLQLWKDAEQS